MSSLSLSTLDALPAAVARPRFGFEDESGAFQPLYTPKLLGLTAEGGLGVRFP